jgi:hypothetical protein
VDLPLIFLTCIAHVRNVKVRECNEYCATDKKMHTNIYTLGNVLLIGGQTLMVMDTVTGILLYTLFIQLNL